MVSDVWILPQIMRNMDGWNSSIWVQNYEGVPVDVTIAFTSTSGLLEHSVSDTIPPLASHTFRQIDMPELGDNFSGWAKVMTDGAFGNNISAVVELGATESSS